MDTIDLSARPLLRWRADWFFLGLALLWGLALITADFRDPTVFSSLTPPGGVYNWLGLPGALLGGSLLELFGPPAPLLVWFLIPLSRPTWHRFSLWSGWYHALLLCWLLSILYVLVRTLESNTVPFEGLWGYGYLGLLGSQWLLQYLTHWEAIAAVGSVSLYAALRILTALPFLPLLKAVLWIVVGSALFLQQLPWAEIPRRLHQFWQRFLHSLRVMALMPEPVPVSAPIAQPVPAPLPEEELLLTDDPHVLQELESPQDPNNLAEIAMLYEQWLQHHDEEVEMLEIPVLSSIPSQLPPPIGLRLGRMRRLRPSAHP